MANNVVREKARSSGVYLWQIADMLGYTEGWFSKMLRHEFPDSKRDEILAIIDKIAAEKEV